MKLTEFLNNVVYGVIECEKGQRPKIVTSNHGHEYIYEEKKYAIDLCKQLAKSYRPLYKKDCIIQENTAAGYLYQASWPDVYLAVVPGVSLESLLRAYHPK